MSDPTGASCLPAFCADVGAAAGDDDDIDDDHYDVKRARCPLFDWAVNWCRNLSIRCFYPWLTNYQRLQLIFGQLRHWFAPFSHTHLSRLNNLLKPNDVQLTFSHPLPHLLLHSIVLLCNLTDYEIVDLNAVAAAAAAFNAKWGSDAVAARATAGVDVGTLCLVLGLLLYIKHFNASSLCLLIPRTQIDGLVSIVFDHDCLVRL